MQNEVKRLTDKFTALFETGGLTNVKFFIRDRSRMNLPDFIEEANKIQDTISAGQFTVEKDVDTDLELREFDAAF